ncbi:MAG: transglycosylase SLT domain-containing protein [Chloroflexi bacterium]|nr:transglycosylase SLT domain-containing protein [Chloroflexota bacterium]
MKGERKRLTRLAALLPALFVAIAAAAACSSDSAPPPEPSPTPGAPPSSTPPATTPATPGVEPLPSQSLQAARLLLREGRLEEARTAFERLAAASQDPTERAEAWFGAGSAAHEAGDRDGSLEALRKAVSEAPPGSAVAVRAGYLAATRLNDAQQYSEALAFARATTTSGPLAPYLQHELARALAGDGDIAAANAAWDALLANSATTSTLRVTVLSARVRLARDSGDDGELASRLDALIAATGDAQARYDRASLAAEYGETAAFSANLLAIIADSPISRFATLAIADLRDAGVAIDPGQEGLVYYRRGAYQEAKRVLLPALEDPAVTPAQVTLRAYYLAAAYEDSGDGTNAVRYYDLAASTGAVSPFIHRARYWAARVSEDLGFAADASQRYVQLASGGPSGEFSEEAAFRAGFVLLRAGETSAALAAWEQVGATISARLEYWRGRALELQGDVAGATAAYQRAIAAGPYDFHGLEAAIRLGTREPVDAAYRVRRLEQPVDWEAIATWLRGRIPGDWPGSPSTAACDLARSGLHNTARDEILTASSGAGAWRTLELIREASTCGLTDTAARLAVGLRQAAGVASHEPPADLLRVSYPIDYSQTLGTEARGAGLDPLFFAALVRQESFWDPTAGSSAGALGLTQVIPATGQGIAAALGVAPFAPADLFRPAIALRFGAYYLGGQVARFGDPLLALTAYNAGPGNAIRWSERERATAADLVESIDYLETKLYVTYIVEAYALYELAWAE